MADIKAAQAGNWSSTSTWVGGVVPTTGDLVWTNNFVVTLDQDITVDSISNAAATGRTFSGGTTTASAGGRLDVTTITSTRSITATTALTSATVQLVNISAPSGTLSINAGTITGGSTNSAGYTVYITSACNLNITATTMTGGTGSSCFALYANNSSGTITVNSTNISNSSTTAPISISMSSGTCSITGTLANTNNQALIACNGAGTINITATGGMTTTTAGTQSAIPISSSVNVNFTGNITAATGVASVGIDHSGSGTVTITGNLTGGFGTAYPAYNRSSGTIIVNGTVMPHPTIGGNAIRNNSSGTVTVTRAKGSDYGPGSAGITLGYGFVDASVQAAVNQVYELEYGARGAIPISCAVYRMVPATTNKAIFCTGSVVSGMKTLIDYAASGDFPSGSNVRYGVSYNNGSLIGSLVVPSVQNVSYGTVFDSGITGTAIITQSGLSQTVQNLLLALT
jgi:hypothetical protein